MQSFTFSETIDQDDRTILYRGNQNGQSRLFKTVSSQHPRSQDFDLLRHEYEIAHEMKSQSVLRPIQMTFYKGSPMLVFDDFEGVPLSRFPHFPAQFPMDTLEFLRLGSSIASALTEIHRENVIHKNITPKNILIHSTLGSTFGSSSANIKITGFEIASRLPRGQHQEAQSPELIQGSLPYISPEQTGRMNRAIDQRTDLYSLGVTFYQMITGVLPFQAKDPLEWVYCHIAQPPRALHLINPRVPETISKIILKLLAKDEDDRFQSAAGLRFDLEQCITQWKTTGRIEPFPLGQKDVSNYFRIPQTLVGRESEIAQLLNSFDQVAIHGNLELVLVSGSPGIGKSALVYELLQPITRRKGFFISGKFDQLKRDVPYSTIRQAFRNLIQQILTQSEERILVWRNLLHSSLSLNAQLIVDLVPEVELILGGKQPPVSELPPSQAQNRFQRVFIKFINALASTEHPLALFLDDLQWVDSATLNLLRHVITEPETRFLFLIGAYRDNEVDLSHPLVLTLDAIRKAGISIRAITLGPLSIEQTNQLAAISLHCKPEQSLSLAQLVHQKTSGNPFFVIRFLTTLFQENLLVFDLDQLTWKWDIERIRVQGYTDNVLDFLIRKLLHLQLVTQQLMQLASCIGYRGQIRTLAIIHEKSNEHTLHDLQEALSEGLMLHLGNEYQFLHDRVQEAAHQMIPQDQAKYVHLQIGRLILSDTPPDTVEERIFEIADQLNYGIDLITDSREKDSLRNLNFIAGKKAKAATAYVSAHRYLTHAEALLPFDAWKTRYDEALALSIDLGECEFLVGSSSRADELLTAAINHARSALDRAQVYRMRIRLFQLSGRFQEVITNALEALQLFGLTLPESKEEILAREQSELHEIECALRGRHIADIAKAPIVTDPNSRSIIGLFSDLLPVTHTARYNIISVSTLTAVNFCLRHGNTEDAALIYSCYSMILAAIFSDPTRSLEFSEMSLTLIEKFNSVGLQGKILFIHSAFVLFWKNHFSTGLPLIERAFLTLLDAGDFVFCGYLSYNAIWQHFESGEPIREVENVSRKYAAFAKRRHHEVAYHVIQMEEQFLACMRGAAQKPENFNEKDTLALFEKANFGMGLVYYSILKQVAMFIYGKYEESLDYGTKTSALLREVMANATANTHYFYLGLALAANCNKQSEKSWEKNLNTLKQVLQKHKTWARDCPSNFRNRQMLIEAEIARIENRDLEAMYFYKEAIQSAHQNGFTLNEALAFEIGSRFYQDRGFKIFADAYLREAHACYLRWGADRKVQQLERNHPQLFIPITKTPNVPFVLTEEQIDLLSVIKASQSVVEEIEINQLIQRLIEVVIEQSGAQRGCLMLLRDGIFSVEVEAQATETGVETRVVSLPISNSKDIPQSIVQFVWRTKEKVILGNASDPKGQGIFASDAYFEQIRPKSVLCLPIATRKQLVGLLYLENNLTNDAFTPAKITVLEVLASRAAISLEVALLLKARDEFIMIASHELRTPLTPLKLYLETLIRMASRGAITATSLPQQNLLNLIQKPYEQMEKLSQLVEDLLNISQIRTGKLSLHLEPINLSELVQGVIDRYQPQLEKAKCLVDFRSERKVEGQWDPLRIEQIFVSLLTNALKYGAGQPIEITITRELYNAKLIVRDHGIGIAKSDQERIFRRFERAVSVKHFGGFGLGLYISQQIAQAHGGTIRVDSELGQGATFTVELPIRDQDSTEEY